jgi:hypothetical protein
MSRAYAVAADPFVAHTLLRGVLQEEDEKKKTRMTTNTKKWTKAKEKAIRCQLTF